MRSKASAVLAIAVLAIISTGTFSALLAYNIIPNPVRAAITSNSPFSNIVIIAMENQNYGSVMGSGTGSSSAPFLQSMLAQSATMPNYHSYGAPGNPGINGCSAGCYVAFMYGSDLGQGDGYSCCLTQTSLPDQLNTAGISWQAYCESGCPRGPDHFPFIAGSRISTSSNIFAGSGVSTTNFISAANSANPPSFLWFTPTDGHNMHDNSIQTGDSYLKTFLVGNTGSITSPGSGSLLASSLFTSASYRTLLYLWWDEYDPSPNLLFGSMIKKGFISTANNYDEFSSLRMIENAWGLAPLLNAALPAAALGLPDLFGTIGPPVISTSFTVSANPIVNQLVNFASTTVNGVPPYSISWNFGDSATATGLIATHTYATTGSFTVTETAADSAAHTASSTQTISVTNVQTSGTFDTTWFGTSSQNCPGGSTALVNGVLQIRELSPGGNSNAYGYCTVQRGTFPWGSTVGNTLPGGITSVSGTFNFLARNLATGSRYHIYIALYMRIPSTSAGGSTYAWTDTQTRAENIGGVDSPVGKTESYNPGDSFGWDIISLQVPVGAQGITITANVAQNCQGVGQAWGFSQPCTLAGVEIGTEGYNLPILNTDWTSYQFATSATCTNGATNPPACNICPTGQNLQNGQCVPIQPSFNYSLTWCAVGSCSQAIPVTAGSSANVPITAILTSGTTIPISLACPSNPAGVTCSFNPNPVSPSTGGATSTLTVTATLTANTGAVTVTGSPSSTTGTTTFNLAVTAPPGPCSNGATDPPTCIVCPTGYTLQNAQCVKNQVVLSMSYSPVVTAAAISTLTGLTVAGLVLVPGKRKSSTGK